MTEWVQQGNIKGPIGPVGPANELVVGEVEALPYDQPPYVVISPVTASPPYQVIDFGIPAGEPGTGDIQWDDIVGKPATFPPTVPIAWTDVSGKPATFPPTLPINWSGITGQPATYPPTLPIPQSGVTGLPATITALTDSINLKADIASPTFTGDPKAPTPATSDNDTSIATTAYVTAKIAAIPPPPPGTTVSATAPSSPQTGAMWWDTTNKTLKIWDGSTWQTVYATWDDSPASSFTTDFSGLPNQNLGAVSPWTFVSGTATDGVITSGKLAGTTVNTTGSLWHVPDLANANHWIEYTVALASGSDSGPFCVLRAADTANYVGIRNQGGEIQVYKRVGGTMSSLFSSTPPVVVGDVLRLEINGQTFTVKRNGAQVGSTGSIAAAGLTSTRQGFVARAFALNFASKISWGLL